MPRNLDSRSIRLVPLGGLGEIGMNCLALEAEDGIMVVDCGTSFPHDDLGVDVLHPDFAWLLERAERVHGIVITHGHEDHIGGLPYLLHDLDVPIWGPPHALGLARRRLSEHDFDDGEITFRETAPRSPFDVGPFAVEPVRVTHSITEATALSIRTPAGMVLHTGDFKLDDHPTDGERTDEERLRALGDDGVALMFSDSTGADVDAATTSERDVGLTLDRLVGEARGLVVIALFASNVQRLGLLGDIARKASRRICLLGRSLVTQHEIATRIGRLAWPSDLLVAPADVCDLPRGQVLVLAGGTQGEPQSSFRRIAAGTHREVTVEAGDTVIMSSRVIPGNELPVAGLVDELLRRGAIVHTRRTDPLVHASGHAGRPELARMLDLVRPRAFVPVHGTLHFMQRHAELARERGVREVLVIENGTAAVFDGAKLTVDGPVPFGKIPIDVGGEPLVAGELDRRADLGRRGLVIVSVVLEDGRAAAPPTVTTHGVPRADGDPAAARAIASEVARVLEQRGRRPSAELRGELARAARRHAERLSGTRPVVEVHLVEV